MQRNNLLFKYVHTVEEKNLPSFSRVGIKCEQRDWFMDDSCSYSVAKAWVEKDNEELKKVAQIPHEAEGSKRESLVCDSWKSVGGLSTRELGYHKVQHRCLYMQRQQTKHLQFDCCMEIRMYSNSNSAYQHFYQSDSYPNNACYVKDPYSEKTDMIYFLCSTEQM